MAPNSDDNGKKLTSQAPPSLNHDKETKDESVNRNIMTSSKEDDTQKSDRQSQNPPSLLLGAPWWSKMVFYWPFPLLKLGMQRPLVETDIPEILPVDSSRYNREYLSNLWQREVDRCKVENQGKSEAKQRKPSLHRALFLDFFRSIWYIQPIMGLTAVAKIVQAVYLGNLIESFEGGTENGYAFAGVIVACAVIILFEHRKSSEASAIERNSLHGSRIFSFDSLFVSFLPRRSRLFHYLEKGNASSMLMRGCHLRKITKTQ